MAQYDIADKTNALSIGSDDDGHIHWLHIHAGAASGFGGLAIDVKTSGSAITTYYYWPNSSGVLRYGTTAPTTANRDTAGAAV